MKIYVLKRLLLMIPTIFGVMLITFTVTQFVPGGPVEQMANQIREAAEGNEGGMRLMRYRGEKGLDPEQIEKLKSLYNFDKPPYLRFWNMMQDYVKFDLGESYFHHSSVIGLIIQKLPVSVSLGLWTFIIVYLICIPLGIRKAISDGSRFDVVTSTIILVGYAIPGFVLGLTLLVLLGGGGFLDIFPLRGLISDNWHELSLFGKIGDYLWHITLPVVSSVVGSLAVMTMLTKNSFIEEIRKQYVLSARAKGLSENTILYKHVFRNAVIPIITAFPAQFIMAFFAGSLLIETIFSLDGLGLLSYNSVIQRDYPVVLGILYLVTILGLLAKLITDLCYVLVDPRIQFESVDAR